MLIDMSAILSREILSAGRRRADSATCNSLLPVRGSRPCAAQFLPGQDTLLEQQFACDPHVTDVLSPGGRAGLQIITIRDELFGVYRRRADFIQKYIFPGGMLPSETRLRQETDKAGLDWQSVMRFGQDYADTLSEWMVRFDAAWDDIRKQGFDDRFRRMWRFYLAYCEAGFRTERTDVIQLSVGKA